jgi:hypothetical protein
MYNLNNFVEDWQERAANVQQLQTKTRNISKEDTELEIAPGQSFTVSCSFASLEQISFTDLLSPYFP